MKALLEIKMEIYGNYKKNCQSKFFIAYLLIAIKKKPTGQRSNGKESKVYLC